MKTELVSLIKRNIGTSMLGFAHASPSVFCQSSLLGHRIPSSLRPSLRHGCTPVAVPRHRSFIAPQLTSTQMSLPLLTDSATTALWLAEVSAVNGKSLGATAFVFFLTFWGGISFVKGSTKPRETQASFTVREPASAIAKRTTSYLVNRAFVPDAEKDGRPGVVTFTGKVRASTSVAALLVSVGASAIWSATYILNFVLPESIQSPYWGLLSFAAFAIVPWYWKAATRTEEVKVMVEESDDISTLFIKGHRDEIAELEKAFNWKRDQLEEEESGSSPSKEAETVSSK